MKKPHIRFFWSGAGLLVLSSAVAQTGSPSPAHERQRIAHERTQALAQYEQDELACQGKLAVTDCSNQAQSTKRQVLSRLRREEIVLKDQERKVKAARQLDKLDARARARDEKIEPEQVARKSGKSVSEKNEQAHFEAKLRSAQEHRQRVEDAQKSREKKPAQDLETPR